MQQKRLSCSQNAIDLSIFNTWLAASESSAATIEPPTSTMSVTVDQDNPEPQTMVCIRNSFVFSIFSLFPSNARRIRGNQCPSLRQTRALVEHGWKLLQRNRGNGENFMPEITRWWLDRTFVWNVRCLSHCSGWRQEWRLTVVDAWLGLERPWPYEQRRFLLLKIRIKHDFGTVERPFERLADLWR